MALIVDERNDLHFELDSEVVEEVKKRKQDLKAVILAHNYQLPEIQLVADFVGDSLELALKAAELEGIKYIFFCGVHFMAETAAILNPEATVVVPDHGAGCPLADMIEPEDIEGLRKEHPNAPIIAYVNTSAAVKARVDICCTSSNAVRVVDSLPEKKVVFVPDRNLAAFVAKKVSKEIIPWNGFCPTHMRFTPEDVEKARQKYPEALIVVHPECIIEVQEKADYVLSTGGMYRLPANVDAREFVLGTENGMLFRLKRAYPDKQFYPLNERAICPNMKKNTLSKLLEQLRHPTNVIKVDPEAAQLARKAIERMLALA
jgi:quinolinate synthase